MNGNTFEETFRQVHGTSPPSDVHILPSQADILNEARGFMQGMDFTMTLQTGCPGGCLFCYVPAGRFLTSREVKGENGDRWGFEIRTKDRAVEKFERHLASGKLGARKIYWSGVTDPYASSPDVTRGIWQKLLDCAARDPAHLPDRMIVQTRYRVDRDRDLMAEYVIKTKPTDGGPAVVVSFSLGTDRDDLIRAWEKATPSFTQRMRTITTLREAGIFVVVTLSPFGLWNDLQGTLKRLQNLGVAYVTVLFFKQRTRSAATPRAFLDYLSEHHPEVLDAEWQSERLEEIRSVFGERHVIEGQEGFTSLANPQAIVSAACQ